MTKQKPPKELDAISDIVLAYRPKPKTEPAKNRRKMQKRIIAAQASDEAKHSKRRN